VRALGVAPDGQSFAFGSDEGWVAICGTAPDSEPTWISAYKGKVYALAIFPDGRTLVTAGTDLCSSVRLWDMQSGRRRPDDLPQKMGGVRLLALSPDGEMLAWDTCGQVRIYNVKKELHLASLRHQLGKARALAFTPDSRTLAVALTAPEGGSRINLFNIAAGRHAGTIFVPHTLAGAVAFTPDGRLLASGHDDGQVTLWDASTGRLRTAFQWHEGHITALAFAPDGMTAAAGYQDGTIVVWDVDCL
jgi:WD40 repeat protein